MLCISAASLLGAGGIGVDKTCRIPTLMELRAGSSHSDLRRWKPSWDPLESPLVSPLFSDFLRFCKMKGMCEGAKVFQEVWGKMLT